MWEQLLSDVPNWGFAIFLALILVELGLDLSRKLGIYRLKDTLCSLTMSTFYLGTKTLMKGFTFALMFLTYQLAPFHLESNWMTFILCYIVMDLAVYWYHRFVHEVRFGWAAHIAHHSSREYNLGGTALRQSFAEPFFEPFFYALVPLLGFDPIMALVALEVNLIYMFWVHSRRMGKLHPAFEWLMSTPSHHRVHHARNVPYLDKNYGGTFIVWDRLFGTFAQEQEAPEFGILQQLETHNPLKASLHSWQALARDVWHARGLGNKLGYLVMPPGWAPDGQGLTTRQLQAQHARESAPQGTGVTA